MKPQLIFGMLLMLSYAVAYGLGISSLDITLHIEAKGLERKQVATALCYSGWAIPDMEAEGLSGTLKLNLSPDSTALGFSFEGLKRWLEVQFNGNGDGSVSYGKGWKRRSL